MEPSEVQEFAHKLQESGESGGQSLKAISLAISILAVLVAMVTVLGHRAHTEAILMETRTSDQWNEYQAKKIRMDSLSVAVDLLSAAWPGRCGNRQPEPGIALRRQQPVNDRGLADAAWA